MVTTQVCYVGNHLDFLWIKLSVTVSTYIYGVPSKDKTLYWNNLKMI